MMGPRSLLFAFFLLVIFVGDGLGCSSSNDKELTKALNTKLQILAEKLEAKYKNEHETVLASRGFFNHFINKITKPQFLESLGSLIDKILSVFQQHSSTTESPFLRAQDDEDNGSGEEEVEEFFYGYLDEEKVLELYETSKWWLGQILQMPLINDILNDMISKIVADLPIATINELVELVPWTSLDSALQSSENIDVDSIKMLVEEFLPLYYKTQELLGSETEANMLNILRFALNNRLDNIPSNATSNCKQKRVVCYYANWSFYRQGEWIASRYLSTILFIHVNLINILQELASLVWTILSPVSVLTSSTPSPAWTLSTS